MQNKKIDKEKIKTWFVTGASSGIGHEICRQLLIRGYNVVAVARRLPDFRDKNILCLSADVTNSDAIQNAINDGIKKFGRIDVLSNNAGISSDISCEEESLAHMKYVMDVNFFGAFNTINTILPHFRKNGHGTIINNTSECGVSPRKLGTAYCSSKYALEGLSAVCWHECKRFCRIMTLELGFFKGTEIGKNKKIVKSNINEYQNIPSFYKKCYFVCENKKELGVSLLLDQIEYEKLPRHLTLGKDACFHIKAEIECTKKDLINSKKISSKCSFYNYGQMFKLAKKLIWEKIIRKAK